MALGKCYKKISDKYTNREMTEVPWDSEADMCWETKKAKGRDCI